MALIWQAHKVLLRACESVCVFCIRVHSRIFKSACVCARVHTFVHVHMVVRVSIDMNIIKARAHRHTHAHTRPGASMPLCMWWHTHLSTVVAYYTHFATHHQRPQSTHKIVLHLGTPVECLSWSGMRNFRMS
jgi:hypothetical protein